MQKKFKIKLKSKIIFDKITAIRLTKIDYYKAMADEIKNLPKRFEEKKKYATTNKPTVTKLLYSYRLLLKKKANGIYNIVKGIYNCNKDAAQKGCLPLIHTNLFSLATSMQMLIVAYKNIRKNKGATTLGAMLSFHKLGRLNPTQRRLLSSTARSPDGISYKIFEITVKLLKTGKYPWGASRRIYIEKPGQPGKLRPITIPPFMDKVVQSAILGILEAVYEPWFEIENRSFGFRKRKGVHDAIYNVSRIENKGMFTAIEGDIKGAYDNVNREKLIEILRERIKDRKFLELIRKRLNYQYLDTLTNKYVEEKKGIPQGGIDSPYLWNIYMQKFDHWIGEHLQEECDRLNEKLRPNIAPRTKRALKEVTTLITKRRSLKIDLKLLKKINTLEKFNINKKLDPQIRQRLSKYYKEQDIEEFPKSKKYEIIKEIKKIRHKLLNIPSSDPNRKYLRFTYTRYADDWIILGNFSKMLAEKFKNDIKSFLKDTLFAELSEEKTLITDIRKEPAHFLGFEILAYEKKKLAYKYSGGSKEVLTRVAGSEIKCKPDKQRIISRLHMKGYCTANGKPKPLSWISTVETFGLISRFNAVLIGFGNFYAGFTNQSELNRWIYIIRTCLFKTLAQKYNTTIRGIFKRFGKRTKTGNTIQYYVRNTFVQNGIEKKFEKKWTLLTEKDIQISCKKNKRYDIIKKYFNQIEYDKLIPSYSEKELKDFELEIDTVKRYKPNISIKEDDWVEKITWVNLRTQANLESPCCICGSIENVGMHHIKHIRKILYSKIPPKKAFLNIMHLRNRRQIPACWDCHMKDIHAGKYIGANLKTLVNNREEKLKGFDNRLVNIENYMKKSDLIYYGKSLVEKGWVSIENDDISLNKKPITQQGWKTTDQELKRYYGGKDFSPQTSSIEKEIDPLNPDDYFDPEMNYYYYKDDNGDWIEMEG